MGEEHLISLNTRLVPRKPILSFECFLCVALGWVIPCKVGAVLAHLLSNSSMWRSLQGHTQESSKLGCHF